MSSWAPRLGSGYSRWMFHEARGLPHLQSCLKTCPGREALEHGTWNWRNHPGFQHKISAQNGPGNGNSLCSMLDGKRWKKGQIGQYIQHPFSILSASWDLISFPLPTSGDRGGEAPMQMLSFKTGKQSTCNVKLRCWCGMSAIFERYQRYHDVQRSYIRAQIGSWVFMVPHPRA